MRLCVIGLARFIAKCNGIVVNDKHYKQIEALRGHVPSPISIAALEAFEITRGMPTRDRNDFHHLNDNVEQDHQKLEARAAECVEGLYTIESEIFAFEHAQGRTVLKQGQYWNVENGMVEGYARFM